MPAPRRRMHHTWREHHRQLAWCFVATVVLMLILGGVSWVFGQVGADHPFPFKIWEEITVGTPTWVGAGLPQIRYCPGTESLVAKYQFTSGSDSIWVVYTDGMLFTAAYFPPGVESPPSHVAEGKIVDGKVVVSFNGPFNPGIHRPCNPWTQKSASGG